MLAGIVDWFKETFEGIKDRFKNPFTESNTTPFSGAFIIALFFYNWELFYSIFTFEDGLPRINRIDIIKSYLEKTGVWSRVLNPLWIAFLSIVLYNTFNNISFAIVILFRRWVRPTVLYFTDRSKIVTKEELEKLYRRLSRYKDELQSANKERDEAIDERNKVINDNQKLTLKNAELVKEKDEIKAQPQSPEIESLKREMDGLYNDKREMTDMLNSITVELDSLKRIRSEIFIAFARYGNDKKYIDVTSKIAGLVSKEKRFNVDNKELGGDPVRYTVKELFVVYLVGNGTFTVTANEGDLIEVDGNSLHVHQTAASLKKQESVNNILRLAGIFQGEWLLTYSMRDQTRVEKVIIDDAGRYFANAKHTFNLRVVSINENGSKVGFSKIDLEEKLFSSEELEMIAKDTWEGKDSKGYRLTYSKVHLSRN